MATRTTTVDSQKFALPRAPHHHPSARSHRPKHKPWQSHMPFYGSKAHHESDEQLSREVSRASTTASRRRPPAQWWKIRLFRGMVNDIRRRAPHYWSDWTDAWDYRVIPATVYMYFAKYASQIHVRIMAASLPDPMLLLCEWAGMVTAGDESCQGATMCVYE